MGCTQVVRGTLSTPAEGYVVTGGIMNLDTALNAEKAWDQIKRIVEGSKGRFVGYVIPSNKDTKALALASSVVGWTVKGHYVAYCVIARSDSKEIPKDDPFAQQIMEDIVQLYLKNQILEARASDPVVDPASPRCLSRAVAVAAECLRRGPRNRSAPDIPPPRGSSPWAATTGTSVARSARFSRLAGQSGSRRPSPTASMAPTRLRTICWQNASACTVAIRMPSRVAPPRNLGDLADRGGEVLAAAEGHEVVLADQTGRGRVERVEVQLALPGEGVQAAQRVRAEFGVGHPVLISAPQVRRSAHRIRAAPRRARITRTSSGSSPASRLSRTPPRCAHSGAATSKWHTWPVAWTPASVRPATVSP